MERIKVLIADDQRLFAHGIEIILRSHARDEIAVAGIAENGRQAVRMAERLQPDVILMDVRMPVMDGTEATRRIHAAHPNIKILVLTTFDDDDYVFSALDAGAIGYVLKNVKPEQLVTAIRAVHAGDYFVSPAVGYKLVQRAQEGVQNERRDASRDQRPGGGGVCRRARHYRGAGKRDARALGGDSAGDAGAALRPGGRQRQRVLRGQRAYVCRNRADPGRNVRPVSVGDRAHRRRRSRQAGVGTLSAVPGADA